MALYYLALIIYIISQWIFRKINLLILNIIILN